MNYTYLKESIKSSPYSIKEVAEKIGMSDSGLRYCLRNESIKVSDLENIATILGMKTSDFLDGKEKGQEKKAGKKKSSINDRLMELIREKSGGSFSKFGEEIGESRFRLSQIVKKDTSFQVDILDKIMKRYPETDLYWLVTGKGRYRDRVLRELEAIKRRLDRFDD